MEVSENEDSEDNDKQLRKGEELVAENSGRVAMQVNLLEQPPQKNTTISPLAAQEKKRPRRTERGEEEEKENPNARSALSFEESGWAQ